jgi:hypothetical protein
MKDIFYQYQWDNQERKQQSAEDNRDLAQEGHEENSQGVGEEFIEKWRHAITGREGSNKEGCQ